MNLTPGRLLLLLLLSVCAGVRSVPIDRNGGNQEVKEEVQEENTVRTDRLTGFCFLSLFDISLKTVLM